MCFWSVKSHIRVDNVCVPDRPNKEMITSASLSPFSAIFEICLWRAPTSRSPAQEHNVHIHITRSGFYKTLGLRLRSTHKMWMSRVRVAAERMKGSARVIESCTWVLNTHILKGPVRVNGTGPIRVNRASNCQRSIHEWIGPVHVTVNGPSTCERHLYTWTGPPTVKGPSTCWLGL